MCGISAVWSWAAPIAPSRLAAMASAQRHRGPDGAGVVVFDETEASGALRSPRTHWRGADPAGVPVMSHGMRLGLAHNLLAIQDPSDAARQPMCDNARRWWLTYNGEIYNFPELRNELVADGVRFRSESDTEVLIALWARDGVAALKRLRGMYAFAMYDALADTLWLARDPFGIKPLHYAQLAGGGGIVAASEVRGVHASGLLSRAWNPEALRAFLVAGVNSPGAGDTFFDGVRELPAGTALEVRKGGQELHRHYVLPDIDAASADIESVEPFRDAFRRSVALHLRSTREVGVCLSGGLDSSNIAAAAAQLSGAQALRCFTVGAPMSLDVQHAVGAARGLGVRHHVLHSPSTLAIRDVLEMVTACETPNHTWGPINQFLMLRHIAHEHGVSVLLNGQGGDEVLSGYPWFVPPLSDAVRTRGGAAAGAAFRAAYDAREPMSAAVLAGAQTMYHSRRAWIGTFDGGACAALGVDPRDALQWMPIQYYLNDALDWAAMRRQQLTVRELPHLLRQEDRLAMWFSIESRVPFVDPDVVACGGRLSPEFLYRDGYAKYPLRVLAPQLHAPLRWETQKAGYWATHSAMPSLAAGTAALWSDGASLLRSTGLDVEPASIARLAPMAAWRFFQVLALSSQLGESEVPYFEPQSDIARVA
jgi:asparagine synthase (glutamine-hydrolysing)